MSELKVGDIVKVTNIARFGRSSTSRLITADDLAVVYKTHESRNACEVRFLRLGSKHFVLQRQMTKVNPD